MLDKLWMIELKKSWDLNGFNNTIVFELPHFIAEILARKHRTISLPQYAILRQGRIKWKWKVLGRNNPKQKIIYTLLCRDKENWKLETVQSETWKKIKWILWNISEYILNEWRIFTAKKYLSD